MLPDEWTLTRLGQHFQSSRTKGTNSLPTLSVTLNDGLVRRDSLDRKMDTSLAGNEHLLVKAGDIAYNMMRMWQGAFGLATEDGLVSPAYVVLRSKGTIDPLFAAHLFKSPRLIYLFWAYSYGITEDRLRLYFDDFSAIPLKLPSLPEQRRIAEILSTWDLAIENLEKNTLSARVQKSLLMRQLLKGERRLPGFSNECAVVKLSECCTTFSGGTPSRLHPEYYGGHIPWIKSGELNQNQVFETEEFLTESGLQNSSSKIVPVGTILVAMYGATAGVVSVAAIRAAINQAILAVIPNESVDCRFIKHSIVAAMEDVRSLTQGGQPNLNAGIIGNIKIRLPKKDEQRAVASVLQDADAEIVALGGQLDRLNKEKSALMQQLLTGKRRVKISQAEMA